MSILAGIILGFVLWFLVRYLVAGTVIYLAAEIRFAMRGRVPYVVTDEKPTGSR